MLQKIIREAINNRKMLKFLYNGNLRVVEPYELGVTSKDKAALLGIQTGGHSASGNLPDWRLYELNLIEDIKISEQKFSPYFKVDREA